MADLLPGLYEQLLTLGLDERLHAVGAQHVVERGPLHDDEAADRIAFYLGRLLRQVVDALPTRQRASLGVALARDVVALLEQHERSGVDAADRPHEAAQVLRALLARRPDGTPDPLPLPATPLLDTTLLTHAPGEPRVGFQLSSEIPSADRIDVIMAFVRQTGIRPMLDLLRRHCEQGRPLRVLTTTYTGSTELAALEALAALGAQIRVSYDTSITRLHAKAWLFHRASGYSTAYIGSSNLTHSAQVTGLEWNVRVAGARNPDVIEKFDAVFESYWCHDDFRAFDAGEFRAQTRMDTSGERGYVLSSVELRPEPFQSRLLELLALSRLRGWHRNLLVAATGTGKTVMAALDYQRLRALLPRARLLFVAHRKELLAQGVSTFRHALRDAAFGELWVDGQRPQRFEHMFASIQSLAASGLKHMARDHFDVVVIDEFHHAAASTYTSLLEHLAPRELLGLTATPERGDGEPILHWFGHRIAAELRLWDAIDQQRLCPFAYYGISDGTDLTGISWRRGRGYDIGELERLITGNDVLARLVIQRVLDTVPDPARMRALGFCVSVRHAQAMARHFSDAGMAALAVTGETPMVVREQALRDLQAGVLRAVFTVDLFNEGVDVPGVDTLLLLRPTDSATLFLQQLGRGLRRHEGKAVCTVLDFVGRHRKEFQFQRRLGALLGGSRVQLVRQVEQGFPFLPSGCHMQLDAVATAEVLRNLRESLPNTFAARAAELRRVADEGDRPTLARFIASSGIPLEDIYAGGRSWSDLLAAGGVSLLPAGPHERILRRALGRLLHVDDEARLVAWRGWAVLPRPPQGASLGLRGRRLLHMLAASLATELPGPCRTLDAAIDLLWQHPQVLAELVELLEVLSARIDHLHAALACRPEVPLQLHARYTRLELLAALGPADMATVPAWREGVRWLPEERADVFAFTLDKSGDRFSPTTRYRDYAISPGLIHWESQSTTREASETGLRYRQHVVRDSIVLLFARLRATDRAFWFLGPARYVSHEGERPMAVRWALESPLPGDLYAQFAAAVP
ncbi:MAG: DUF3427 domain-containing protein [Xanthomonadaceae bacterium]|nr:DUF3427 domain-containing protein [Xanthomonadaceae bacterium]MDE1964083.1 DUF3427 domain-containing protein [Xanthomonadaceae bacterium]